MKKIILGISASAMALFGTAAFTHASEAWINGDSSTEIKVSNESSAVVGTFVVTNASTGGNSADASSKSREGSSRAKGGSIHTGDAIATTEILVDANSNDTVIDLGCGCAVSRDGDTETEVKVKNRNEAAVLTFALTNADTGNNSADAKSRSNEGSSRAKGGNITTGDADSFTGVGVVVNRNTTRIE